MHGAEIAKLFTLFDKIVFEYDSAGLLTAVRYGDFDRWDFEFFITRDETGFPTKMTVSEFDYSRNYQLRYDSNKKLMSCTQIGEREHYIDQFFEYDKANHLSGIDTDETYYSVNNSNCYSFFDYSSNGLLSSIETTLKDPDLDYDDVSSGTFTWQKL